MRAVRSTRGICTGIHHKLPSLAPPATRCSAAELTALVSHLKKSERLLVVTGAGMSTASGIPDYRSPKGSYSRGHKPIQHADFVRKHEARQRYWTRSFLGWQYFSLAEPNAAHLTLAEMERRGLVQAIVTQNVDGLHSAAGSAHVLDLHGRIDSVECLDCGDVTHRAEMQERLYEANAEWADGLDALAQMPRELRADGDMELEAKDDFVVPSCTRCGGTLKPGVTFFGGSVPKAIVKAAADAVAAADALLVLGSSLQVFSAFRIARAAAQASLPIAILNNGPTRADDLATLRVRADVCDVLPRAFAALSSSAGQRHAFAPAEPVQRASSAAAGP